MWSEKKEPQLNTLSGSVCLLVDGSCGRESESESCCVCATVVSGVYAIGAIVSKNEEKLSMLSLSGLCRGGYFLLPNRE